MARTVLTALNKKPSGPVVNRAAELRMKTEADIESREDFASSGLPPDWLTTGLSGAGAGWLFGPIGGALGLGVAAILSKRRRAGILAQATADAETGQSLIDGGEASVSRLEREAQTPQDEYEAALVREQFNQFSALAQHPNPQIAAEGFKGLLSVPGLVSAEADEVEAAQINRQALDRERFSNEIGRADSIRDDVQREGQSFAIRQDAYERMLVVDDSAAGDQVLLVNAFKMVDPNSAVLPGEAATAANTAGIPEPLVTAYNRLLRDGERLSPPQRADLIRQAGLQYAVARGDQIDRNTDAIERAKAQGIRPELINQISMPVKDGDALPFPALGSPSPKSLRPPPGKDADLAENGEPLTFFEALVTPGAIDARRQKNLDAIDAPEPAPESFSDSNRPGLFDMSEAAREWRASQDRARRETTPGLFQTGGVFGPDKERPTND